MTEVNREVLSKELLSLPQHLRRGVVPIIRETAPEALIDVGSSAVEFDVARLDTVTANKLSEYVTRSKASMQISEVAKIEDNNSRDGASPSVSWERSEEELVRHETRVLSDAASLALNPQVDFQGSSKNGNGSFSISVRVITSKKIDKDGKFECSFCGRKCRSKSDLDAHIRTHTGEKPLTCPICKKKFAHSSNLHQHQRSHRQEKRYKCRFDGCTKAFAHPTSRNDHELFSHMGVRAYLCDVAGCTKSFTAAANLTRHKKRIHGIAAEGRKRKSGSGTKGKGTATPGSDPSSYSASGTSESPVPTAYASNTSPTPYTNYPTASSTASMPSDRQAIASLRINPPGRADTYAPNKRQRVTTAAAAASGQAAPRSEQLTPSVSGQLPEEMTPGTPQLYREGSFPPSFARTDSYGFPMFTPQLTHTNSLETLVDASMNRLEAERGPSSRQFSAFSADMADSDFHQSDFPASLPSPQLARTWSSGSGHFYPDFSMGIPSAPSLQSQMSGGIPTTPDAFPQPASLLKTSSTLSASDFLMPDEEH